MQTRARIKKLY